VVLKLKPGSGGWWQAAPMMKHLTEQVMNPMRPEALIVFAQG